ncbi:MAG: PEP-CTERM sorting domain-containing protein [Verrucomicrobiota bacterium]
MKFDRCFKGQTRVLAASVFLFAGVLSTQLASAWTYNLTNGNSSATVQADTPYGMSDWTVDGQTQLFRQWFWYRKGSTGPEKPLNNLTLTSATLVSPSILNTVYQSGSIFSIEVTYSLLGGAIGSSSSAIGEQIKINNLTSNPLDFHFFQYVDFDLGGGYLGDTVTLEKNAQGLFDKAYQTKGNAFFADEVVSPAANHGEVGLSESTLIKLMDSSPTTLNDSVGPVTGDAIWGFQWDVVIPAYQSFSIAINKSVYIAPPVPEPSSIALLAVGLAALGFARRRVGSGN